MKIEKNKNNLKYSVTINCRINNNEKEILKQLMKVLGTFNKSEVVRFLINNNNIIKRCSNE